MSIQWTLVAGFLYVEIGVVFLLLLPFLRPRTWQKFFKSRFLTSIESQANLYFSVFILVLVLLFLDSIREMTKYSGDLNTDHQSGSRHVDAELQHSMKLFRAQRNFYIAGFALFLFLVIRRLVTLITALAQLDIQVEATMKQAKSASDAAKSMMKDDKSSGDKSSGESKEVKKLKEQVEEKEKELQKLRSNVDALKRQAANLTEEYDRLNAEHQKAIKSKKAEGESKKDN